MTDWKVARDRYYRDLPPELLAEAGFFPDTARRDAPLDDVRWLCTPLQRVRAGLAQPPPSSVSPSTPPTVLLSTGSFCPPHQGHLAMLEAARAAAVAAGWWVVGGYLSPGHDEYSSLKLGAAAVAASTRVGWCARAALSESDWLDADPWEALHCTVAVNFTDVIVRLEAYLRHHLDPRLEVAYVFGGDNARFALTFRDRGRAICVSRPGHDHDDRYRQHPALRGCARLLWVEGMHPGSSTRVRAGEAALLPASLRVPDPPRPTRLLLRDEGAAAALPHWPPLQPRWEAFQAGLRAVLAEHFALRVVLLAAQARRPASGATISLDPMLPGRHNLALSRGFDLGGYTPRGHVARPGSPPLAAQVRALPPGAYTLVDDDRMTGSTLAAARALLPPEVTVIAEHTLVTARDGAEEEIADSRDFLLGSAHGGAVVVLADGTAARAPYVLPYIDPAARSSLPPAAALAVSQQVWALNADFFRNSGLTVGDLPPPARALLAAAGFGAGALLEDACAWHRAELARIVGDQR